MDFSDFTDLKVVGSRKRVIPVRYQKRYKANLSNSIFNQSFAIGIYKRRIKSLLENNRYLVAAVQSYRCECSSKDKILAETSAASLEHIFSARLKLNRLAEVLRESYLSVEEILSILKLCSSTYPSKFTPTKKSSQSKLKRSLQNSVVEPIAEVRESLVTHDCNTSTNVPDANQGGNIAVSPSTYKENESAFNSNSTEFPSRSNNRKSYREILQEFNEARELVEPITATSTSPKASFNSVSKKIKRANKVCIIKNRKRKPSESKVSYKLNSATQLQLSNDPLQNSQNIKGILIADEAMPVFQDDTEQSFCEKKRKLLIQPTTTNEKQCPLKQKLPLSPKKSNKSKTKNTLEKASENVNNGVNNANGTYCHNQAMPVVTNLETDKNIYKVGVDYSPSNLPEQDEDQPPDPPGSSNTHSQNVQDITVQNSVSKSIPSSTARRPTLDPSINDCPSNLSKSDDESKVMKNVVLKGSAKPSTNKLKSRNKVKFQFDSDEITVKLPNEKRCKTSNQRKKIKNSEMHTVSEDGMPILQSVENISCLNKKLSKNSFVVSAEIHPPPPHCEPIENQSVSPKHVVENMQPCVVLTDIFETKKVVSSTNDSSEDSTSCSESQCMKESKNAKVSKSHSNKKSSDTESSPTIKLPERIPRRRSTISYKEPSLNHKMRKF